VTLTLFSRPGCHLCEVMKDLVRPVAARTGIRLQEVDITGNPQLEADYGLEVPVLLLDGTKIAKYRITEEELTRSIEARVGRAG
jgi:glutaredoxin